MKIVDRLMPIKELKNLKHSNNSRTGKMNLEEKFVHIKNKTKITLISRQRLIRHGESSMQNEKRILNNTTYPMLLSHNRLVMTKITKLLIHFNNW